jgi:hypothetical protein
MQTTVAADSVRLRLREDSLTGTALQSTRFYLVFANAAFGCAVYGEYTAASTGNKTFAGTGERASGTGNHTRQAATTNPAYLMVELIG